MKGPLLFAVVGILLIGLSLFAQNDSVLIGQQVPTPEQLESRIAELEDKLRTAYALDGQVFSQSQFSKGWHRAVGTATLSNGMVKIGVNSAVSGSMRNDLSFLDSTTYRGFAWSLDTANRNTYWVYPVSAESALVISSDTLDNATVNVILEGL